MQNNLIQFQDFQAFSSLVTIPFSFVLPMKKLRSVKTLFSFAQNNKKGGMHIEQDGSRKFGRIIQTHRELKACIFDDLK